MKTTNRFLMAALIVSTAFTLTACDDSDVAFGTGVVVGVIIGDHGHDHHPRPRPPRYRGRGRYEVIQLSKLSAVEKVALNYNLSLDQSELLTEHLLRARSGDLSALAELGFEKSDLVLLYKGQNPSASTLQTLGGKLGLEMGEAHELIQNIKIDVARSLETTM